MTPAQVDIALHALDAGTKPERAEARRQRQMQLQHAEYEVELARRRYEAARPGEPAGGSRTGGALGGDAAAAGAALAGVPRNWTVKAATPGGGRARRVREMASRS